MSSSNFFLFFFNDTATTEIYTLSLHDALPIWSFFDQGRNSGAQGRAPPGESSCEFADLLWELFQRLRLVAHEEIKARSEEHTSELQSPCNLVCRLLLEKKKNN